MEKLLDLLKTANVDISEADLNSVKAAFNEAVEARVQEQSKLIAEKADTFSEERIQEEVAKRVAEQKAIMEAITTKYCQKKALTIAKKADRKIAEQKKKLTAAAQKYIVEYFDVEFEKKYGEELEQIEENVLNKLDDYLEHVVNEEIDPSIIESIAINETYAPIISGIQSLFQEQYVPLNASGKKKVKELATEKAQLESSLRKQVDLNMELKESNKVLKKAALIAEACIGMSAKEAEQVREYFEPKKLDETKADLPGFVKMLKEKAEDMREQDPMITEKTKQPKAGKSFSVRIEDNTNDFVNEKLSTRKNNVVEDDNDFLTGAAKWLD